MRTKENQWKFWITIAFVCLLPSICNSKTYEKKEIAIKGNWDLNHAERQLSSPFTAYYDECILTIHSGKPAYDLSITITNAQPGYTVYTLEVPKESSDFITIPLTGLGKGEYCLVISNPEAGYVYGTFNL